MTHPGLLWTAALLVKATVWLLLLWGLHGLLRRSNPRWRMLLWRCAAVGLLVMPVWSLIAPGVEFAVFQRPSSKTGIPPKVTAPRDPHSRETRIAHGATIADVPRNEGGRDSFSAAVVAPSDFDAGVHRAPPHPEASQIPWALIVWSVWATGLIAGLALLAIAWIRLRWWVRSLPTASEQVHQMASSIGRSLGVSSRLAVRIAPEGVSPCLTGIFRPTLVIPGSLCDAGPRSGKNSAEDISSVLAHELAHWRSADPLWGLCLHIAALVYWFHPLAWRICRAHRAACEFAADSLSASLLGDARGYAGALARVAVSLRGAKSASFSGSIAMAHSAELSLRLRALMSHIVHRPVHWKIAAPFTAAVLVFAASLGSLHVVYAKQRTVERDSENFAQQEPDQKPTTATSTSKMRVRILNQQGEPVSGATLNVPMGNTYKNYDLDARGEVSIPLPQPAPRLFVLRAKAPHHVWMRATWRNEKTKDPIPHQFTFQLTKGTAIGGTVVNEDGKPIEGAEVSFSAGGPRRSGQRAQSSIYGLTAKTNAQGKWRTDSMPAEFRSLAITFRHPHYVSDNTMRVVSQAEIRKLRSLTHSRVMERGNEVKGIITGPDGKPIQGAMVVLGPSPFGQFAPREKPKTDAKGQYRFNNCRRGQTEITVIAKGFAPDLRRIEIRPGMGPVDFRLQVGGEIRVRVIDQNGKPVSKAYVVPDTWRGARSLMGVYRLAMPYQTDKDGRFTWRDAPQDAVNFEVYAKGYKRVSNQKLKPRDQEYVVTLPPILQVSGSVRDALSKRPVQSFRLVPGISWDSGVPSWLRRDAKTGKNGKYKYTSDGSYPQHFIRIEADGYQPAVSRAFHSHEGAVRFDFELQPGKGPSGVVLTPDGKPIAGAEVVLCLPLNGPYVRNGASFDRKDVIVSRTDQRGRFTFSQPSEPFALLVFADQGFARIGQADFKHPSSIKVQPWAHVEGRLMIGAKPGVNEAIRLFFQQTTRSGEPHMYFDYRTKTDKDGRFTLDRIPPDMEGTVAREIVLRRSGNGYTSGFTHGVPALIAPGRTDKIALGGTGRPVIGRVSPPPDFGKKIEDWNIGFHHIKQRQAAAGAPLPEFARSRPATYSIRILPDGSFRVEDVPPGEYELTIQLHQPKLQRGHLMIGKRIGWLTHHFTIGPITGERTDKPLDLGGLVLQKYEERR